jgi:hypothetical protein
LLLIGSGVFRASQHIVHVGRVGAVFYTFDYHRFQGFVRAVFTIQVRVLG